MTNPATRQVPLPARSQRGNTLGATIALSANPWTHLLLNAALLAAVVPQRVIARPDPRPTLLIPRWSLDRLVTTVDALNPTLVDEIRAIGRASGWSRL